MRRCSVNVRRMLPGMHFPYRLTKHSSYKVIKHKNCSKPHLLCGQEDSQVVGPAPGQRKAVKLAGAQRYEAVWRRLSQVYQFFHLRTQCSAQCCDLSRLLKGARSPGWQVPPSGNALAVVIVQGARTSQKQAHYELG